MKFSTKMIEDMAEIMVKELERIETGDEGIMGVENHLRQMQIEIGKQALSRYLSRKETEEKSVSCSCGGQAQYHSRREAMVMSVFGRVSYKRSYYVCTKCHKGQIPRDEEMGLAPGEVTAGLAQLLGLAGVEVAYEEASRIVKAFLLIEMNDNTIRKETEQYGAIQAAEEERWKVDSQDAEKLQKRLREKGIQAGRIYGSIDGAIVPLKGEWRELKSSAWYLVKKVKTYQSHRHHKKGVGEQNSLQADQISYACEICDAEEFGSLLWATGWKRLADLYQEVVFICDGAAWIWRLVEKYFPCATQIVDWYHASSYLAPVADGAFGHGTPQAIAWLEQARTDLWEGRIQLLIQEFQRLALISTAAEAAHKAMTYYQHNEKRMDYARFRAQGYLIGSGTMESGCKQIAGHRLKLAGARWTSDGCVQTAKARAAWLSGDWNSLSAKRAILPLAV
jgi:hypothetical protein